MITDPAPVRPARTADDARKRLKSRIEKLLQEEFSFIHNAFFEEPVAEAAILRDDPIPATTARHTRPPEGLPAYLASLYEIPLLTPEQEFLLFRRMNYCRYRANVLRSRLNPRRPSARQLDKVLEYLAQAENDRNRILQANLRLVVSIARRLATGFDAFEELVSDGNLVLVKAIEKFDFSRGFRFSTYATHAVQREFYRQLANRRKQSMRFASSPPEFLCGIPDEHADCPESSREFQMAQSVLVLMNEHLDERERSIVAARFGLDRDDGSQTLRQIAREFGISKERVRQLQIRALDKLQDLVEKHAFESADSEGAGCLPHLPSGTQT